MKTCDVCNRIKETSGRQSRSDSGNATAEGVMVAHMLPSNGVHVCLGKLAFPKFIRKGNHINFTSHTYHGTHRKHDLRGKNYPTWKVYPELSYLEGLP